jgi:methyl-accepting chemotaxis protein
MSRKEPIRRRRLFWYRSFQPGFVWGLGGAVLAALLSGIFSLLILVMVQGRPVVPDVFPVLIVFNVIALLALLLIVYWVVLFVSHRMGGPLHRMQMLFEDLGRGRLDQRVDLRRDDQLQEVAQAINRGVGSLRDRLDRLRQQLLTLRDSSGETQLQAEAERLCKVLDELFVI